MSQNQTKPPSKLLLIAEWRAVLELGAFLTARPLLRAAPRGSGPVLVLPGFLASDTSTKPLRGFLSSQGYSAYGWELGRNLGPRRNLGWDLMDRLKALADRHGEQVAVIGWSLGGIYARQMAKKQPALVRQVISLGSPFRGGATGTNSRRLYEWVTGTSAKGSMSFLGHPIDGDPPVPFTAVYSRSDGVCTWQSCVTEPTTRAENIQVFGSHCGLGHNPAVLYAIADRLARSEFKPFVPPLAITRLYPSQNEALAA